MTWRAVKIIAVISMTLDHFLKIFTVQPMLTELFGMDMAVSYYLLILVEPLGRVAFPLYAFGIAQGCTYTKNKRNFLLRLLIFAVIAEVPFQYALGPGAHQLRLAPTNVLFTLLYGALACFSVDFFKAKGKVWLAVFPILALMFLGERFHADYGAMGILFVLTPYLFPTKKGKLAALSGMILMLYLFQPLLQHSFDFAADILIRQSLQLLCALLAVAVLALYNGQKGRCGKLGQYFFYAYYPAHLAVLYWAAAGLGYGYRFVP